VWFLFAAFCFTFNPLIEWSAIWLLHKVDSGITWESLHGTAENDEIKRRIGWTPHTVPTRAMLLATRSTVYEDSVTKIQLTSVAAAFVFFVVYLIDDYQKGILRWSWTLSLLWVLYLALCVIHWYVIGTAADDDPRFTRLTTIMYPTTISVIGLLAAYLTWRAGTPPKLAAVPPPDPLAFLSPAERAEVLRRADEIQRGGA
jgi:hypothetical protein